ncbi:MAG: uncharacterized membrane protein YjfL (UPF0719 family) [Lentimonas sp.]|jgi:uncharacterized membrane protein YjfL (UPF0719 family)
MSIQSLLESWFNDEDALQIIDSQAVIYLVLSIALLAVGKKINDLLSPYDLNEQLTQADNKAIALSFAGYLIAIIIIICSILNTSATTGLWADIADTSLWCVIGILLLQASRFINNKWLLHKFDIWKELIQDKNVGAGAIQCGAYIGSACMIKAALYGEDSESFVISLISAIVYFLIGQVAFVLFSKLYQRVSRFDLHEEIENDNVAAGVGFGMSLTATGILLSGYLMKYDSFIGLALWFVMGAFLLIVCRYLVDKILLPGSELDEEISRDRNWGAALIEGSSAIGLALILTSLFG